MKKSIIVVDDFYKDPFAVRNYALKLDYVSPEYKTGYPGTESQGMPQSQLQSLISSFSCITGTKLDIDKNSKQGHFRLMDEDLMKTRNNMIHTDQWRWTGVIYLSKPEDCNGGLSFFRHKETALLGFGSEADKRTQEHCDKYGKSYWEMLEWFYQESLDLNKWDEINFVSCKFNRLLLFEGSLFHGIKQLFGNSKNNTRLSQHFFIHEIQ